MTFMLVKGLSALRITIHILTEIYNRNQQIKRKFRCVNWSSFYSSNFGIYDISGVGLRLFGQLLQASKTVVVLVCDFISVCAKTYTLSTRSFCFHTYIPINLNEKSVHIWANWFDNHNPESSIDSVVFPEDPNIWKVETFHIFIVWTML